MRRTRFHRLTAFLAIFALFCTSSAFIAHAAKGDVPQHKRADCQLCLQFNGTGGAATVPPLVGTPAPVSKQDNPPVKQVSIPARPERANQPRAPPHIR